MATCRKRHHRKWCLSDKWRTKKLENCHIHDCIVLISTVQKKTVGQNPHSSLLASVSYSSAAEEKKKCDKCHGRLLCASSFLHWRVGISVFCVVRTFSSMVLFAQFSLCRALVLVFLCIEVYKWPPTIPTWTALRCALSVRDDDLLLACEIERLEGFKCVQWVVLHFSVLYTMPSFHPTHSASVPHGPLGHSWLPSKLQASRSKEGGRHVSSQVASHT